MGGGGGVSVSQVSLRRNGLEKDQRRWERAIGCRTTVSTRPLHAGRQAEQNKSRRGEAGRGQGEGGGGIGRAAVALATSGIHTQSNQQAGLTAPPQCPAASCPPRTARYRRRTRYRRTAPCGLYIEQRGSACTVVEGSAVQVPFRGSAVQALCRGGAGARRAAKLGGAPACTAASIAGMCREEGRRRQRSPPCTHAGTSHTHRPARPRPSRPPPSCPGCRWRSAGPSPCPGARAG